MTDTNMPAVEATNEVERELNSYELAFHILPTIAEGEVKTVFEGIKRAISESGGLLLEEEVPARFDLAYDIRALLEGKNRKFSSAYFGWVRFELESEKIAEVTEMVEGKKELLRHLLIRLTKMEEENPFYFHPSIADRVVETTAVEAVEEEVAPAEVAKSEEVVGDGEDTAVAV